MPYIIDNNPQKFSSTKDHGYVYPDRLDLKPGSALHGELVTAIYQRARESSNEITKKHDGWKDIDRTLTAYRPTSEAEDKVKEDDYRKPVSVVIPFSFATLETLLTYFVAAFLENPIFKYEGTAPEDILGAIMLEKAIDQNCQRAKVGLALHTMWRDNFAYGLGPVNPTWVKEMGFRTKMVPDGFMSRIFSRFINTGMKRVTEETVIYEGNSLTNIDPYLYLPDPNVAGDNVQGGEFSGWVEPSNYMKLLSDEGNSQGTMFNVKYLNEVGTGKSVFNHSKANSGREEKIGSTDQPASSTTKVIDVVYMYVNLIPKEWKLSTKETPEKWLFGLAADKVIIRAQRLGMNHNKFPVAVCATDYDGYSVTPLSRMEMINGLQTTLDWLFNSHIANVRKSINDMLVVDPSLINMNDLKDPQPGKLVRMRRSAWGRGVEKAVAQLKVEDITKQHISDSAFVVDLMQKCSAAVDSVMGVIDRRGERVSSAEARGTRGSALSRLAKAAKIASLMAMHDIGYMFASHTQQMMSRPLWVTTTGRWSEKLAAEYGQVLSPAGDRLLIQPENILIDYDVMIKDGSVLDGDSDIWTTLFQIIMQSPELNTMFDIPRIFKHIARLNGAKDVDDFIRAGVLPPVNVSVQSNETVMREAEKGNVVPMPGGRV